MICRCLVLYSPVPFRLVISTSSCVTLLVKRDLKDWNISKEIALDRSAWRLAINVPEP